MRGRIRNSTLALVGASAAWFAGASSVWAASSPTQAIAMDWQAPYVSSAPWQGHGNGVFSASGSAVNDSGSLSVNFHLGAQASPNSSVLNGHSYRVLTGALGTISLRCNEAIHKFANANSAELPLTGNCTVLSASGAYAGLHGQGKLTGVADTSGANAAYLSEVLQLRTS